MELLKILSYHLGRKLVIVPAFLALAMVSCSKPNDIVTPILPPAPPVNNIPTGVIQTFSITDTLVAFNYGSTIKWLVNGTNDYTVVTLNGVKIGFYGVLQTGPLKQNTTFTLMVNSGKQASVSIKVADSVSTLLWNEGKRLRLIKAQVNQAPSGQITPVWVDTTISKRLADQRIFFNYDGSSTIIQLSPNSVSVLDAGRFVVDYSQKAFTWQGVFYTLETLSNNNLVVTYCEKFSNGSKLFHKDKYLYE